MFFFCFAAFLLLAPLYKAGNRPLPLLLLELAALGFLFVIVVVHRAPLALPRTMARGDRPAARLPAGAARSAAGWRCGGRCPGTASMRRCSTGSRASGGGEWRAISVIPSATEYGWLALLPPLACLLGAMQLSTAHVARLMLLLAILAGAEGRAGTAAGRSERRRDPVLRQRGTGPVRGDRHVRQSQSSRGDAGDGAAGDRRSACLQPAPGLAASRGRSAIAPPSSESRRSECCCSRRR